MGYKDLIVITGLGTVVVLGIFTLVILGTLVGAFVGWIVSMTPLGPWVVEGFKYFGFQVDSLTSVGAMLGFTTGFLHGIFKAEVKAK